MMRRDLMQFGRLFHMYLMDSSMHRREEETDILTELESLIQDLKQEREQRGLKETVEENNFELLGIMEEKIRGLRGSRGER